MNLVSCGLCRHFIHPEPKYERNSIGECSQYSAWVAKWGEKKIPMQAGDRLQKSLGNKIFMTDVDRYCEKFNAKIK